MIAGSRKVNVESHVTTKAKDTIQVFNDWWDMTTKPSELMPVLQCPYAGQGNIKPGYNYGYSRALSLSPPFIFTLFVIQRM